MNWYRDEMGRDLMFKKGISAAPIFSRRLIVAFAIYCRIYNTIKYWLSKAEILYASKEETAAFKRVANCFSKKIKWYEPYNILKE